MNISLKKLLNEKNIELPSNLIKFADLSEIELLKIKKTEMQYMELLKSRLNDLKAVSIITDQTAKLAEEEKINSNITNYLFRHQAGTFRHTSKIECTKEYIPLVIR